MQDVEDKNLLSQLNDDQREAVAADAQHILVLAGAGSGKTRVLAHRVAYIASEYNVAPQSIMAVTFTNKAAREMRARIENLLGFSVAGMWIGTFHGLSHRLLRAHWQQAGLNEAFQILDADDQKRLVRRTMRQLNIDENQWQPQKAQWFINSQKQAGRRARHITDANDFFTQTMLQVYRRYEQTCEQNSLVDFAELLLRAYELLRDNPDILAHYQKRFQHMLVDEFQDTNHLQYQWLTLLAGHDSHVMIVGDDDQSIYGWRGAEVANLHNFQQAYPDTQVVRLQRNYRSTPTILKAANHVIQNNSNRMGKTLWTDSDHGPSISLYDAFNEVDEARYIKGQIKELLQAGYPHNEIAILYRANAQSRVIEETLGHANIPYRVYGGLRFFERAEIKDALAYLRLLVNPYDDAALERVINMPPRGIGQTTINKLRETARAQGVSLWHAGEKALAENRFSGRSHRALESFYQLIAKLTRNANELGLAELTSYIISSTGLWDHYNQDRSEKGQAKLENLEELISAARQFVQEVEELTTSSYVTEFLASAALEAGDNQGGPMEECVQLMTLHAAKGLEFSAVFLCGMEEGLFPLYRALDDPDALEEERRLCYVGMTRARYKLYMTYAEIRKLRGRESYQRVSRFLKELPEECVQGVRPSSQPTGSNTSNASSKWQSSQKSSDPLAEQGLYAGARVYHPTFGEGTIVNFEGQGPNMRIQVRFPRLGPKWLVAQYAPLKKLG